VHVLLISPRSDDLSNPAYWLPLGILYVAAALQDGGHDVRVIDMALDPIPGAEYQPELIGVSCTTPNYLSVRSIIEVCHKQWPGVTVVVGGPHVSIVPEDGKRLGADITISGDGEEAMLAIADGLPLPSSRPVDINQWPIPARNLVKMDRYAARELGHKSASLIGQRGCCFSCCYCCKWPGYQQVRYRDLNNVVEEIEQLKAMGYRALRFFDDELNLNERRLLSLCAAIKPLSVEWTCLVRANLFTEVQASAMIDSGCRMVQMGIESGSDAILKGVNSAKTVADNTKARSIAKSAGLQFWAFFVVGLPGESHATVQDTRRWIIENRPDMFSVYTFQPFPGTQIYKQPQQFDIQFPTPLPYDQMALGIRGTEARPLHCLVSTSSMRSEEIIEARRYLDSDVRKEIGL
jgi:anaerobic magnesium-protoporphyrin IX monomethyl ester cyclase